MSALAAVPTKTLRGSEQPEPEEDGGMQEGPDTMCYRGLLKVELYAGERRTERTAMERW
jgi:hypothetical protein